MIAVGHRDCNVIVNKSAKPTIKGAKTSYLERFGLWVHVYGLGPHDKSGDVLKLLNDRAIR